ncbi:MAG: PASTA domain-containing protein [Dysgonamonadaceae bacterium]|jgi:beta-lactam-binding protein with PASTA domain|nr:PASTA domain-containing protein [Dysgonamonadaceae bacterium]
MKAILANLLLVIIVSAGLVWGCLTWLDAYTSRGESVEIPNVKSMKPEVARPLFDAQELFWQVIDSTYNKTVRPGTIIETIPPIGSRVKKGRTIYIRLNSHSAGLISIPDVVNLSQRQATTMLKTLGLETIEIKWVHGNYHDLVVGLEYQGRPLQIRDKVPVNATVTLLVSSESVADEQDETLIPNEEIIENSDSPINF